LPERLRPGLSPGQSGRGDDLNAPGAAAVTCQPWRRCLPE